MSAITEPYYKELRLDAPSLYIWKFEVKLIYRPFPDRFWRLNRCPRGGRRTDFWYLGIGPVEFRVWRWW